MPARSKDGLLDTCFQRFSELRASERLFYDDTTPETIADGGYVIQFHLIPAFKQKPWANNPTAPAAKPDPFGDPEPDFVVAETEHHLVQLNKFCAVRPQVLVHPKKYAPQAESLTCADFDAAMQTMDRLGKSEWVAFYNCGIESGSSQPYRHVQIIPRPNSEEFLFFPDKYAQLASINKSARPTTDIPFFCLLVGIAGENADIVYSLYEEMLARSESTLGHALVAHNAVFTTDWLCVIPRRRARIGICAANAMGMMGLIWVANQEERDVWDELGLSRRLSDFGYTPIRSKE